MECGILWAPKAEDFASYNFRDDRLDGVFIVDKLEQEEDGGFLDVITILPVDFVCHVFEFLYSYKE
jgi:hypothetical protein